MSGILILSCCYHRHDPFKLQERCVSGARREMNGSKGPIWRQDIEQVLETNKNNRMKLPRYYIQIGLVSTLLVPYMQARL